MNEKFQGTSNPQALKASGQVWRSGFAENYDEITHYEVTDGTPEKRSVTNET